eukprot:ANDGO_00189.mRNA.1 putative 3'
MGTAVSIAAQPTRPADLEEFSSHLKSLDAVFCRTELNGVPWYCGFTLVPVIDGLESDPHTLRVFATDLRSGFYDAVRTYQQLAVDKRLLGRPEYTDWGTFFAVARAAFLSGALLLEHSDFHMILSVTLDPQGLGEKEALRWVVPLDLTRTRNWRRDLLPAFVDALFESTRRTVADLATAYSAEKGKIEQRLAELREKRRQELKRGSSIKNLLITHSAPTSGQNSPTSVQKTNPRLSIHQVDGKDSVASLNSAGSSSDDEGDREGNNVHVTVPVDKVLDILKRIRTKVTIQRAALGKAAQVLSNRDVDDLDYVLETLATNSLYFPDLDDASTAADDAEISDWVAAELVPGGSSSPVTAKMGKSKFWTLKRAVKAIAFANTLKKKTDSSVTLRMWAELPDKLLSMLEHIDNWSFDVFELNKESNGRPMYYVTCSLLQRLHLTERFSISQEKLIRFLQKVESMYHANPYHNNLHAADVTQTFYYFMRWGGIAQYLSPIEQFAAILACTIHDLGHPGVNNAFEVRTQSPRALLYNDQSVLEMFHLTQFFELLSRPEYNILEELTPQERKTFRDLVVTMVLSTDMSKHFGFLGQFKAMVKRGFKPDAPEDLQMVLQAFLKASDISNPSKPLGLCVRWADRVMVEFFMQGDKERSLGLTISPFCDRYTSHVAKCQLGFLDYVVLPFFQSLAEFQDHLKSIVENHVIKNRQYWAEQGNIAASQAAAKS